MDREFWEGETGQPSLQGHRRELIRRAQEQIPALPLPFLHAPFSQKPAAMIALGPLDDGSLPVRLIEVLLKMQDRSPGKLPSGLIMPMGIAAESVGLDFESLATRLRFPLVPVEAVQDEWDIHLFRGKAASSFLVDAATHDRAGLQYLIEVGREYSMEAIVTVQQEEDWKVALQSDAMILRIAPNLSWPQARFWERGRDLEMSRFILTENESMALPEQGARVVPLWDPALWLAHRQKFLD